MDSAGHPKKFTGTGSLVVGSNTPQNVRSPRTFILVAGVDAAACDIKEGGSSGTVVMSLAAAANTQTNPIAASIANPYLSALTGTSPSLIVLE